MIHSNHLLKSRLYLQTSENKRTCRCSLDVMKVIEIATSVQVQKLHDG